MLTHRKMRAYLSAPFSNPRQGHNRALSSKSMTTTCFVTTRMESYSWSLQRVYVYVYNLKDDNHNKDV